MTSTVNPESPSSPGPAGASTPSLPVSATPAKPAGPKPSMDWIFIAKGIGIVLVVIGHFKPPESPLWWAEIHHCIYTFHMPLFFVLSGFLYSHGKYPYGELVLSKTRRLIYPFFAIGLCFFVIKLLTQAAGFQLLRPIAPGVTQLGYALLHPLSSAPILKAAALGASQSLIELVLQPMASYMPLLWFVHALFLIFVIYPLLRNLLKSNWAVLFVGVAVNYVILAILQVIGTPEPLGMRFGPLNLNVLGPALDCLPLFAAGVMLREAKPLSGRIMGATIWRILVPVAVFATIYAWARCTRPIYSEGIDWTPRYLWIIRQGLGFIGTLAVVNISFALARLGDGRLRRTAIAVGYYSMTIYLFHPLFESGVRIGFLQGLARRPFHLDVASFLSEGPMAQRQTLFLVIALTAIVAGVLCPLLLEKYVLRKNKLTSKYLLGMD